MKLEIGKHYKTRSGLRATCVADNLRGAQPCAVVVHTTDLDMLDYYTADGFYRQSGIENQLDLISEWVDKPEVNWSVIPPWFKYGAFDQDGSFWVYTAKPDQSDYGWVNGSAEGNMDFPSDYAPKWTGDWKQSLVERPKEGGELI